MVTEERGPVPGSFSISSAQGRGWGKNRPESSSSTPTHKSHPQEHRVADFFSTPEFPDNCSAHTIFALSAGSGSDIFLPTEEIAMTDDGKRWMAQISPKLRSLDGGRLMFWCPGCDGAHQVGIGEGSGPRWGYNGNPDAPTFTPSVMVSYNGPDAGIDGAPPAICHSFVTDGKIQFLQDCTHSLAGQTVELPDFD